MQRARTSAQGPHERTGPANPSLQRQILKAWPLLQALLTSQTARITVLGSPPLKAAAPNTPSLPVCRRQVEEGADLLPILHEEELACAQAYAAQPCTYYVVVYAWGTCEIDVTATFVSPDSNAVVPLTAGLPPTAAPCPPHPLHNPRAPTRPAPGAGGGARARHRAHASLSLL